MVERKGRREEEGRKVEGPTVTTAGFAGSAGFTGLIPEEGGFSGIFLSLLALLDWMNVEGLTRTTGLNSLMVLGLSEESDTTLGLLELE